MFFENDPRRSGSVYRLGKCLFELGRNEMAFMELMNAKQLNRDNQGLTDEELQDLEAMLQTSKQCCSRFRSSSYVENRLGKKT
jgi:hypothetical protein